MKNMLLIVMLANVGGTFGAYKSVELPNAQRKVNGVSTNPRGSVIQRESGAGSISERSSILRVPNVGGNVQPELRSGGGNPKRSFGLSR